MGRTGDIDSLLSKLEREVESLKRLWIRNGWKVPRYRRLSLASSSATRRARSRVN